MDGETGVDRLARCHGYRVVSGELFVGEVETPLFAAPLVEPEFLLVRTGELLSGTFRMLPAALVVDVDPAQRQVAVGADGERLAALPDHLPARRGGAAGGGSPCAG
jgi:hypothetical protein